MEDKIDILLEFEPVDVDRYGNKYIIFTVVGFKSQQYLESGYVWAPYVPLQIMGGCDPALQLLKILLR